MGTMRQGAALYCSPQIEVKILAFEDVLTQSKPTTLWDMGDFDVETQAPDFE